MYSKDSSHILYCCRICAGSVKEKLDLKIRNGFTLPQTKQMPLPPCCAPARTAQLLLSSTCTNNKGPPPLSADGNLR
jgi:hypothetical protein